VAPKEGLRAPVEKPCPNIFIHSLEYTRYGDDKTKYAALTKACCRSQNDNFNYGNLFGSGVLTIYPLRRLMSFLN